MGGTGDGGRLPAEILSMMEEFGRFELNPQSSGIDPGTVWQTLQFPLWEYVEEDPRGFVTELAEAVLPVGGWAAYGAHRTIMNLLTGDYEHPDYDAILESALQFLRHNGVPLSRLNGYEWRYWQQTRAQKEPWLSARPAPPPDNPGITPLGPGEVRRLATLTTAPDSNVMYVARDGDSYLAIIDSKQSDDDPRRVRWEYKRASSHYELYLEIGLALEVPPPWVDPQLRPYIPFPPPRI